MNCILKLLGNNNFETGRKQVAELAVRVNKLRQKEENTELKVIDESLYTQIIALDRKELGNTDIFDVLAYAWLYMEKAQNT